MPTLRFFLFSYFSGCRRGTTSPIVYRALRGIPNRLCKASRLLERVPSSPPESHRGSAPHGWTEGGTRGRRYAETGRRLDSYVIVTEANADEPSRMWHLRIRRNHADLRPSTNNHNVIVPPLHGGSQGFESLGSTP